MTRKVVDEVCAIRALLLRIKDVIWETSIGLG